MRRLLVAAAIALAASSPAAAWDPDAVPEPPEPEPPAESAPEPPPEPPSTAPDPTGDDGGTPAPVAAGAPDGIYLVTDTYVKSVVTTNGDTTTYTTDTKHETPGSYARVIAVVTSGETSTFDGSSFNGRATLPNGTPVAGVYYENYVLTSSGYVAVSIVFFQDDSITRTTPRTPPSSAPEPPDVPYEPPTITGPSEPIGSWSPDDRDREPPPSIARLDVGIALAADGPILGATEVLRGREVRFWPRAFSGGDAVAILSWRLVSQAPDYASAMSGGAAPLVAEWRQMPRASWTLVFEVTPDTRPARTLIATINVAVRSPALIN